MYDEEYWDGIFKDFADAVSRHGRPLPSVSTLAAATGNDRYAVLVGTIISLRTKDEVTLACSRRLLDLAPDVQSLDNLAEEAVARAICPAGFYRRKASQLKAIAKTLVEKFDSKVPGTQEELLSLPGVGVKTANLTLSLGFGVAAICVDCHVHQIANRMGWIATKTPEESVGALEAIMPRRFWIPLNELLVAYGQTICLSVSPLCSQCPRTDQCPKLGVARHR